MTKQVQKQLSYLSVSWKVSSMTQGENILLTASDHLKQFETGFLPRYLIPQIVLFGRKHLQKCCISWPNYCKTLVTLCDLVCSLMQIVARENSNPDQAHSKGEKGFIHLPPNLDYSFNSGARVRGHTRTHKHPTFQVRTLMRTEG